MRTTAGRCSSPPQRRFRDGRADGEGEGRTDWEGPFHPLRDLRDVIIIVSVSVGVSDGVSVGTFDIAVDKLELPDGSAGDNTDRGGWPVKGRGVTHQFGGVTRRGVITMHAKATNRNRRQCLCVMIAAIDRWTDQTKRTPGQLRSGMLHSHRAVPTEPELA